MEDEQNRLAEIKKEKFLLPINLNKVKPPDYHSSRQLSPHLKKGEKGDYFLVFRDIEKQIPPELLETQEVDLKVGNETVNIKTLDPGVILHLYIQRATMRPKDRDKLWQFLRKTPALRELVKHPEEHRKYRVFHEFSKEIRDKYPFYSQAKKVYGLLDYVLFNSLFSHKFIPRKLLTKLTNF